MRWLKMFLVLIVCFVILFIGAAFAWHNTDKVSIDLLLIQLPEASLSLWLIAFFVIGGICGTILSSLTILSLKTKLNLSRRKVVAVNKELAVYRTKNA